MVVSSLVVVVDAEGEAEEAFTTLDNGEWLVTTMAGIVVVAEDEDADDDGVAAVVDDDITDCLDESRSVDEDESTNAAVDDTNVWESTEPEAKCVSKHMKTEYEKICV